MVESLMEIQQAARRLGRAPGFSLTVVLMLGLGLGAASAIFSLVNGVLLSPLPYSDSDRLMWLGEAAPGWDLPDLPMSLGAYLYYKEHSRLIEDAGLYLESSANLLSDREPERVRLVAMTPSLLSTLGVRPLLGRPFSQADDLGWPPRVVLLGHDYWVRRFGADPAIVGETIRLNDSDHEIIGVMPPQLGIPDPGVAIYTTMNASADEVRFGGFFRPGVARVRIGVTPAQLKAEMDALLLAMPQVYDVTVELIEEAGMEAIVTPLKKHVLGDAGRSLWMLLAGVGLLLIIAWATVSNLLAVRAESRSCEAAVRRALGASRGRLLLHALTEVLLLGLGGGIVGLGIAAAGIAFVKRSGIELPRLHAVTIGVQEAGFTLLLAVATILVLALSLARWSTSINTSGALLGGARAVSSSPQRHRGRNALIAVQIALSLPLVFGSALMVQSLWHLRQVDPGFDSNDVLTAYLALPGGAYPTSDDVARFYASLAERLESTAGVQAVGFTTALPLTPGIRSDPLWVDDLEPEPDSLPPFVTFKYVSPGYFDALGIPLLEGSLPTAHSYDAGALPVTVNKALVDQLLAAGPTLARRVRTETRNGMREHTIAAVVGSVLDRDITGEPTPILYFPLTEGSFLSTPAPRSVSVVVRTSGDPLAFVGALRAAIWELDPDLPVASVQPLEAIVSASMARTRFTMTLLLLAASTALLLGGVGLYAVISFAVGQRTREIGVRMALGARASAVRKMILAEGATVAMVGLVAGTAASFSVGRLFANLVYGISPSDPLTLALTPALLFAVALAATYLPARRAAAVDPAVAIRSD